MRLNLIFALAYVMVPVLAADSYLFTSFRGNGEDGVYLASSDDGYKWTALNGNKPWLKPGHPGMLMRDPCLRQGADGVFRMVWTSSWGGNGQPVTIGYASSKDLVNWSEQKLIPAMPGEPTARNAWAPELLWDAEQKQWLIFWATTIPGRFASTDHEAERPDLNHRIYATSTRDFETFTPARLFFDPGFDVIDSTINEVGRRYVMVFKDERAKPEARKNLRLAFADAAGGPYAEVSETFTRSWVEGPSMIEIGGEYFVYFDNYRKPRHYGAMKSRDLKNWEDVTEKLSFPADHRHGTVIAVPRDVVDRLRNVQR